VPVIRRTEHFDLSSAQKRVWDFLSNLLRLDERETGFFTGIRPEGIPARFAV